MTASEFTQFGQSIWLDGGPGELVDSGRLLTYIDQHSVPG